MKISDELIIAWVPGLVWHQQKIRIPYCGTQMICNCMAPLKQLIVCIMTSKVDLKKNDSLVALVADLA